MAQVLQLRRGTTAQNNTFTGAAGEVTVDTDRESLRVHDGATMGGKEIADLQTAVPLLPAASSVSGSDTVPVIQSGVARRATKTQILNGIVNANVDAAAAIAGTKIAPNFGSQNITTTGNLGVGAASSGYKIHATNNTAGVTAWVAAENSNAGANSASGFIAQSNGATNYSYFLNAVNGDCVIYKNGSSGQFNIGTIAACPIVAITNNAERMRIDASGNVGIGTSSPAYKLDCQGGTASFSGSSGANAIRVAGAGGAWFWIDNPTNNTMRFSSGATAGTGAMVLDTSGNVGIGTSSPSFTLDVNGPINTRQASGVGIFIAENSAIRNTSSGPTVMYFDSGVGAGSTSGNFDFRSTASYTSRLYINGNIGNVGLGTTAPNSRLHIAGDLTVSSATTSTTATTTAGGSTLPALAAGYLVVSINGTSRKIPFYAT